jgi:vacuolar-type H+-ATPase subunit H
MPDESAAPSPEILREIQAAERKVACMVQAAEQEAVAILDKARSQAEALLAKKRRVLEQKKKDALTKGIAEAEREAEELLRDVQAKASELKIRCMGKMDQAVELVLKKILPQNCYPLPAVRKIVRSKK